MGVEEVCGALEDAARNMMRREAVDADMQSTLLTLVETILRKQHPETMLASLAANCKTDERKLERQLSQLSQDQRFVATYK